MPTPSKSQILESIPSTELLDVVALRLAQTQQNVGSVAAVGSVNLDWLDVSYELSVTALEDMGFDGGVQIPSLTEVKESITPATGSWLNERRTAGHTDELVIAPSIQKIGVMGSRGRRVGLVDRFNRLQPDGKEVQVLGELWEHYDDQDPLHDNNDYSRWSVGVLLGDKTDPIDPDKPPANRYDENGLVYTNLDLSTQKDIVQLESLREKAQGRDIRPATVAQIVVVDAQRRIVDRPMLDERTVTNLVQYPKRRAYDVPQSLGVCAFDGIVRLTGSAFKHGDFIGVRRALRLPTGSAA